MASTDILDITDFKEMGAELRKVIVEAVRSTQSVVITTLPNIIKMTQKQYDSLLEQQNMVEMYQSTERMYVTPYNVMEVQVEGRTKKTFAEAHNLIVDTPPAIGKLITDTK
jgi:hypothetical protein